MKYSKGQKVRIKPLEWFNEHTSYCKEDLIFSFCGEEATITGTLDLGYTLNIGPECVCWNEGCFETIEQVSEVYQVSEKDLIGDIKDFPIEVVKKMVERQVQQGNKPDVTVFQKRKKCCGGSGGFDWADTIERGDFWRNVIEFKHFDVFFQKYPKQNQLTIQKDMETNKLILNGITLPKGTEAKVTVEEGTTIITFQKQEEIEEHKFKDGEMLFLTAREGINYIAIFKSEDDEAITIHGWLNTDINEAVVSLDDDDIFLKKNIEVIRYATEEEIVKFNKEFADQKHLEWNAEEFKFEPIRWRAEYGGKYWYIGDDGEIHESTDIRSCFDKSRYNFCNYFQTKELIKQAFPKLKEFFKSLSL